MSSPDDRGGVLGPPGPGQTQSQLIEDARAARANVAEAVPSDDTVVTRIRDGVARTAGAVQEGGDRAFEKLPAPVADTVRPVWTVVSRRPLVFLGGLAAAVGGLLAWLRIRSR